MTGHFDAADEVGGGGGAGDRETDAGGGEGEGGKWGGGGVCGEAGGDDGTGFRLEGDRAAGRGGVALGGEVEFQPVAPTGLDGEPGEELEGGVAVGRVVADLHGGDVRQRALGDRVVEQPGDAEAELPRAGPFQVLEDERVGVRREGFDAVERGGWLGPLRGIDDQAVDDADEAFGENGGEFALPPEDEGEIGIEVGEDGVAEAAGDFSGEMEGDLLAADGFHAVGEVAVGGDPGADGGLGMGAFDADEDCAAGVLAGEVVNDRGIFDEGAGFLRVDDEVHQRGVGAGFVLFPELAEFPVDGGDGDFEAEFRTGIGDGGGHGRWLE